MFGVIECCFAEIIRNKVGQIGVTTTPLRLSGKGRFADEVLDIVSRDEYLEAHTSIKIVAIEATRVVVVRHIDAS